MVANSNSMFGSLAQADSRSADATPRCRSREMGADAGEYSGPSWQADTSTRPSTGSKPSCSAAAVACRKESAAVGSCERFSAIRLHFVNRWRVRQVVPESEIVGDVGCCRRQCPIIVDSAPSAHAFTSRLVVSRPSSFPPLVTSWPAYIWASCSAAKKCWLNVGWSYDPTYICRTRIVSMYPWASTVTHRFRLTMR